jgi:hypothetical protein
MDTKTTTFPLPTPTPTPTSTPLAEPVVAMSDPQNSLKYLILTIFLYIGLIIYFSIVAYKIFTRSSFVSLRNAYLYGTLALWGLYAVYRYLGGGDFLDDMAFLVGNFLFITMAWALTTNMTGDHSRRLTILIGGLFCLVVFPPIFHRFFSPSSSTTTNKSMFERIKDIYWNTFTSYSFLVTIIIVALLLILTNVHRFNMPNLATWQMWLTIACFVFGIKYMLLYRFSFSNLFTIFAFLGLMSFLVFLIIQPSGVSKTLLTVVFSLACILFAVMLPTDYPFLLQGFFFSSLLIAVGLGLVTQTLSSSTMSILFAICSLYLVIHLSNVMAGGGGSKAGDMETTTPMSINLPIPEVTSLSKTFCMYFIILSIVLTLYFTDDGTKKQLSTQVSWIVYFFIIVPFFLFGGLNAYFQMKNQDLNQVITTDGIWIGTLFTLVGMLLISIYLISKRYNTHINYSIVAMMLIYVFGSLVLMVFNLKNWWQLLFFLAFLLLPVGFVSLFQSENSGAIAGAVFLLLLWSGVTVVFWKYSSITFPALLNMNSLVFTISGLMLYLIFYYIYLTFTSKASVSQQFSQIVLICMFSYLLLQIFKTSKMASNPFISFVIHCLEYIPCLIDSIITRIIKQPRDDKWIPDLSYHSLGTKILAFLVLFMVGYYLYPRLKTWYSKRTHTAGVVLVGESPISTQGLHLIKTYEELTNKINEPIYNYGISFDVYINPSGGNDTFYNLVNFTGNLFVTYNTQQNQLYIYAVSDEETPLKNGETALYRHNQFPLQKWVKIEINYVGGVYDIFVENHLKTSSSVISHNSHDNIFVGSEGSAVVGKVKNFIYYPKPLSVPEVKETK